MPTPADILALPRPKNTVVYVYGKNKDKYGVKKRIGCEYRHEKNYPINGPTIGHIIDHTFVPLEVNDPEPVSKSSVALKNWGDAALCFKLSRDLSAQLRHFYNEADTSRRLAVAILRVCNPGITDRDLKEAYDDSMLSDLIPACALSKNSVCKFQNDLGKACDRICHFMHYRTDRVGADHHLLVDGTLKSNNSRVNSLGEFSRKARLKNSRDISVLYAFDFESNEPVCSQCFPGNMLDLTAYDRFVKDNGIRHGFLVADKGFPEKSIEELLRECPDLHCLNPLRRSSKLASDHRMYEFQGVFEDCSGFLERQEPIQYKKEKLGNKNKWLYSFWDSIRAAKGEKDWLNHHSGDAYDPQEYEKKKERFGTVVFESDIDITPAQAWKTYSYRWQIEIVMRYYKNTLSFDETRVHDDYSVIGSEFIDFLSTVITFKLLNLFDKAKLIDKMTYKGIMRILKKAMKVNIGTEWELVKMNPSQIKVLQEVGLIQSTEEPVIKKKRPTKKKFKVGSYIGYVIGNVLIKYYTG